VRSTTSDSSDKSNISETDREKDPVSSRPSFAKGLFYGRILSSTLFPYPTAPEGDKEVLPLILEAVRKFGEEIDVERIENEKRIPPEYLEQMRALGLFGLIIPEEYGGAGLSASAYSEVLSQTGLIDSSITATIGAHQSIGMKALLMFGNESQKRAFLPRMATGEWIAAFGLTEPGAGSDVASLRTTARLSEDGTHYILDGGKIWITNGGLAHVFTVFAKTQHADANGKVRDKITAFLVTRDLEGFSSGPEEKKLGLFGSSTTTLHFDNVRVPVENVIGLPGGGFKIAMQVLNNGRLGLATACALCSKKIIQLSMEHAQQRRQFGRSLKDFDLISSKFANMAVETFAAESLVRITAALMDRGTYDTAVETAMCKVFSTEAEWRTINEAIQIAGGTGYMREYGYEKILRDSRIFMIWEGANEVLRLFIGLSGLQGPGEQLKELAQALRKPFNDGLRSLGLIGDYGVRWIQRRVTVPEHLRDVHPLFHSEAQTFDKYTAILAEESETLLRRYGKKIIENEYMIRRVADISIDLYAMACTLARGTQVVREKGEANAEFEISAVKGFCRKARRRIAENVRRLQKNDDELERKITRALFERDGYRVGGNFSLGH